MSHPNRAETPLNPAQDDRKQERHAFQKQAATALLADAGGGAPSARQEEWRKSDARAFDPGKQGTEITQSESNADDAGLAEITQAFSGALSFTINEAGGLNPAEAGLAGAGVNVGSLFDDGALQQEAARLCETVAAPYAQTLRMLNAARAECGYVIEFAPNAQVKAPVLLNKALNKNQKDDFTRNVIIAKAGSNATVIDLRGAGSGSAQNDVIEIFAEDGATLTFAIFADGAAKNLTRYRSVIAKTGRDTRLNLIIFEAGGRPARYEIHTEMTGAGAEFSSYVVSYPQAGAKVDFCQTVTHNATHCRSFQNYRTLTGEGGGAAVQSKTIVTKNGQKTDASQSLRALTVGKENDYFAKPELEIYADDVKCAHGSAVGKPDEAALFYMRSRGISEEEARYLLTEAFLFADIEESGLLNEAVIDALKQNFRRGFSGKNTVKKGM